MSDVKYRIMKKTYQNGKIIYYGQEWDSISPEWGTCTLESKTVAGAEAEVEAYKESKNWPKIAIEKHLP